MEISRRGLLQSSLAVGLTAALGSLGGQAAHAAPIARDAFGRILAATPTGHGPVTLRWLEGAAPAQVASGATWGVPWPKGALSPDQGFSLTAESGVSIPVQSWPTGWWPDGTVKWTAHAISGDAERSATYTLAPGDAAAHPSALSVADSRSSVVVNTGTIRVEFPKRGRVLVSDIRRGATVIAENGRLVASRQNAPDTDRPDKVNHEWFESQVDEVVVEQTGPVRAVIRVTGTHKKGGRNWLPFDLRFYLYAGSDGIRVVHSFVFDGDEKTDFINGLGVQFDVPLPAQPHDRHVRFAGAGAGVLGEAVRGITGLRRDPGAAAREAQIAGAWTPDPATWDQRVTSRLKWIPAWGDYSLSQLTAHGFEIRKRTSSGHSWIRVDGGTRSRGLAYIGTPAGGLAFGMRNFWQLHPTELEISGAATDRATATVWMWSPRAEAMDLRFYHDGMGQDTYPEQLDALEITYEDYEPGFGSPYGVARTTELMFWALPATPTADAFSALADANSTPPLLVSPPEHNHSAGVFGSWSPVDRSSPAKIAIEDKLAFMHDHYVQQVDQRSWYGFWDYGDVMHDFDRDRHVWRYDIGGYAWDNSELSTDMWLWYHYLRTGDATAFRFAEAMTRHTGEVDVYHLGQWADLGTRHGIMHWGDSAKQQRISNAGYRRFYYFLTADERVGDLLHDLVDADKTFLVLDPSRKVRDDVYAPQPDALAVSNTTDWGALGLAWLAEWERNGDPIAQLKLTNGAKTIAAMPNGWAQGGTLKYNLEDGTYAEETERTVSVGSLDSVFGLFELMTELIDLMGDPEVERQWVNYCRLYNGTSAEQIAITGTSWGGQNLRQAYSRATAYAATRLDDTALAQRAWKEFRTGHAGYPESLAFTSTRVDGTRVLNPIDEAPFSTNASAQYGLAAIQNLALVGNHV
ncbi:Tat pathway signal sequence domain protein [Agromyces sp. LHK192]|uniref:exo-rhamnogalacturonan lyase family protein n=1 Tax=Agromyces sp. LHK192 TaxID=2498704 RepID=UPI000FD99BBF|nr:Tat pathway signal sequence domain protein [Agromyces sp. LHK192]